MMEIMVVHQPNGFGRGYAVTATVKVVTGDGSNWRCDLDEGVAAVRSLVGAFPKVEVDGADHAEGSSALSQPEG